MSFNKYSINKKIISWFTFIMILTMLTLLNGCDVPKSLPPSSTSMPTDTPLPTSLSQPSKTILPETTPTVTPMLTASPTPAPSQSYSATPSAVNPTKSLGVSLYYEEYAQFELIDPQGRRVLIDIFEPGLLSVPASDQDILLVTHAHFDHYNASFIESFPGQKLVIQTGILESPGLTITGIASAHNAGDGYISQGGTNYIYLIEMGGLRIAHFGDIGQEALTSEQLEALRRIDVALTQLVNPYSNMNLDNRKGFELMEQLQPRLIIPTHANCAAIATAAEFWPAYYADTQPVRIEPGGLSEEISFLALGNYTTDCQLEADFTPWDSG